MSIDITAIIDKIAWNEVGLVPVIVQDVHSKRVLMMAWMNETALQASMKTKKATFWSRSRQRLWQKGERSNNTQNIQSYHLDCDGDTLLLLVEQQGGIACHTGRESCFYRALTGEQWRESDDVLRDPNDMYN